MLNIGLVRPERTKLKYSLVLLTATPTFFIPFALLFVAVPNNIKYDQAHPWFKDTVWDELYETKAAFKPEVNGELDTQNFMQFDEASF